MSPATPFLVLVSREDPASLNIRDALREMQTWTDVGQFRGLPVYQFGPYLMVEIDDLHLEADLVDVELKAKGWRFDTILVASKHKAESGRAALTVHPIGNPVGADYGGRPRTLVPTNPIVMGRILRRLAAEAAGLKHQVTFEATHHGPYFETPTMFVEIGTDETAWTNRDLGRRVARAILHAHEPTAGDDAPTLIALGCSHYAPKITDLVKQCRANVGHIIPGYALQNGVDETTILEAIEQTPNVRGYHADLKVGIPENLLHVFASLEMGMWRDEDLPATFSPPVAGPSAAGWERADDGSGKSLTKM